jgi:lipoprotein-anchoring transpeptidase ErfK/SrfK
MEVTDDVLLAFLGEKKLEHWRRDPGVAHWRREAIYAVSSGKNPPSCVAGSEGTPWGLHCVAEKFGEGASAGTVFIGRVSTGERYFERQDAGPEQRMFVTTRILRLRGLEAGLNAGAGVDSYDRYIYIHGTTRPEQFPENLSGGCLTLLDEPLIELYGAVPEGSLVWIEL